MSASPEILVVDDDLQIRKGLRMMLTGEGFSVRIARNGAEALGEIAKLRPDLVLLDVMMPGQNGYAVCAEIRKTDATLPILFLTAKGTAVNELRGFDVGADDFVAKSAPDAVLLARIRRALARAAGDARQSAGSDVQTVSLGPVRVDLTRHSFVGGGVEGRLTPDEASLLRLLAASRGQLLSYAEIAKGLWGDDVLGDVHLLSVHVHNIKAKLGRAGELIRNERGVGYRLMA